MTEEQILEVAVMERENLTEEPGEAARKDSREDSTKEENQGYSGDEGNLDNSPEERDSVISENESNQPYSPDENNPEELSRQEGGNLKGQIEAILFVAGEAVELRELSRALDRSEKELLKVIADMESEYDFNQRGFMIKRFGNKVQLATRPLYAQDVIRLLQPVQRQSLSQAAMETLAVIAYKQPVTRGEVEAIRGVKCDYSVQSLTRKGLIAEVGRKDTIGHPVLFGTTDEFLSRFGIESLDNLPPLPTAEEEKETEESEELIP